jgi:hypothetical protein
MLTAFVIWSVVALLFFGIGISSWNSKKAVGFFSFVKPPIVVDVRGYNHSVGVLWMVVAIILELLGVPFLFIEQNSPIAIVVMSGVFALVIGMIIVYIRIEIKYEV